MVPHCTLLQDSSGTQQRTLSPAVLCPASSPGHSSLIRFSSPEPGAQRNLISSQRGRAAGAGDLPQLPHAPYNTKGRSGLQHQALPASSARVSLLPKGAETLEKVSSQGNGWEGGFTIPHWKWRPEFPVKRAPSAAGTPNLRVK